MFRRALLSAPLFAAVVACTRTQPMEPQTVVVFFTANSAALDPAARAAVDQAAATAKQRPSAIIHIRGFAAPDAGSPEFNRALSLTRAEAVGDALVAAGVPRIQLTMETRGAVPFDLMPTESRRVEIVIGT